MLVLGNEQYKELEKIQDNNGELTADAVIEAARSEDSALHGHFTWDDKKAAHERRLQQAHQLILAAEVEVKDNGDTKTIAGFVCLKNGEGYTNIVQVLSDEEKAQRLINKYLRELKYWRQKTEDIKALAPIHKAIDRHVPTIEKTSPPPV